MKNRKTLFIVGGAVLTVIIAVVVIVCSVGGKKNDAPQVTPGTDSEATTSELKIDDRYTKKVRLDHAKQIQSYS